MIHNLLKDYRASHILSGRRQMDVRKQYHHMATDDFFLEHIEKT